MTSRDPRTDPRPGDAVRNHQKYRTVIARGDAFMDRDDLKVIYETPSGRGGSVLRETTLLSNWNNWCRGAEVVRLGPPEGD